MLVIKERSVVEIGAFDLDGSPLGDSQKFLDRGFIATALEALVALPQSFGDGMGESFSGGFGNGLSKTMGFRIFHIEAHIYLSVLHSTFLYYIALNAGKGCCKV